MKAKIKGAKLPKSTRKTNGKPPGKMPGSTAGGTPAATAEMEVKWVLRKEVRPDANQPRKTFDEGKLKELAESITAVGIRQPIQVEWVNGLEIMEPDLIEKGWRVTEKGRPGQARKVIATEATKNLALMVMNAEKRGDGFYKIVDGERRWRAAELAKVERIPVMVVDTSSPDWEKRKLAIQVVLNQQHENLTALEEAAAYGREIESGRHTAESLYKTMGISRGSLFQRLALNRLEPEAREALLAGQISVSVAGLLNAVRKEELPNAISQLAGRPFREAQKRIEEYFARQLKDAAFDQEQPYALAGAMVPASEPDAAGMSAGCKGCGYRSGNLEGSGLKNPNVCTEPKCFDAKTKAAADLKLAAAREKGHQVISETTAATLFHDYGDCGVRSSSGYVDLDAKIDPYGNLKKTWREALKEGVKEGKIKIAVAIDPSGAARELVKEIDAKPLAHKAGFKLDGGGGSYTYAADHKRHLAQQRKKKGMEKVAGPASATILEKLVGLALDRRLWPLIARSAFEHTSIDAHAFVAKRRGLTKVQTDCREKLETWFKENGDNATECARMAVDLLFCACWNGGSNYTGGPKWDKGFVEACEWAGVKLDELAGKMEEKPVAHAKDAKDAKGKK